MKTNSNAEWFQPIAVNKAGSHEDTILLGALASLRVFTNNNEDPATVKRVQEWLAGPFTKTVRRGNANALIKISESFEELGLPTISLSRDSTHVIAMPPMLIEEMPKTVSKLQVSGTDFPREPNPTACAKMTHGVAIHILDSLTTGKATAQASHALWRWWLMTTEEERSLWHDKGEALYLKFLSAKELAREAALLPHFAIHDAGHTEVEPQTLTAFAVLETDRG